jgi:UDP-N-acetylmuramoyl-tripeptide--D-alanyl-D-alanine ligase
MVPNVRHALAQLAVAARDRSEALRVGITGSSGKTSAKNMLSHLLTTLEYAAHCNPKSFNNTQGVSIALATLPPSSQVGVFEMGMNHAGELTSLAALVRPHVALITSIGQAHIGFLGSIQAIATAKAEVLTGLSPGGVAVLPRDAPSFEVLQAVAKQQGARLITFGTHKDAMLRLDEATHTPQGTTCTFVWNQPHYTLRLPWPGRHWPVMALGLVGVLSVLRKTLCPDAPISVFMKRVAEAFEQLPLLPPGRGRVYHLPWASGELTLIDESYNANPESMEAALDTLSLITANGKTGRRVAILGDMGELGATEQEAHTYLAVLCARDADKVITVGPLTEAHTWPALRKEQQLASFRSVKEALEQVPALLKAGDVVTVKASRGAQLDLLTAHLRA